MIYTTEQTQFLYISKVKIVEVKKIDQITYPISSRQCKRENWALLLLPYLRLVLDTDFHFPYRITRWLIEVRFSLISIRGPAVGQQFGVLYGTSDDALRHPQPTIDVTKLKVIAFYHREYDYYYFCIGVRPCFMMASRECS